MRISSLSLNLLFVSSLLLISIPSFSLITADELLTLESAAIDGDVNAQSQLASMYYLGEGVEQNLNQAFAWYQLAAEQGDATAQYSLGNLFLLGEGTSANKEQAIYWYEKSAQQGHKKAQSRLNLLKPDLKLSERLTTLDDSNRYAGAPLGDEPVEEVVTIDENENQTVSSPPPNKSNSENLFEQLFDSDPKDNGNIQVKEQSIELDSDNATVEVKDTSITKQPQQSNLQPGPIVNTEILKEESKEKTFEPITKDNAYLYKLYNKAREGDADAQYLIGNAYYLGNEIQQNLEQAFLWYRRSAENGHIDAQFQLANVYLMGEGVNQDDEAALYWYGKAAEQNHPDALKNYDSLKQFSTIKDRTRNGVENTESLESTRDVQKID